MSQISLTELCKASIQNVPGSESTESDSISNFSPVSLERKDRALHAETHWFHMLKAMVDDGDIARLGPHATTVYLVIKAHANLHTGLAFPKEETIVRKSGISLAQVKRELKTLLEFGYISKKKVGRHNEYRLREKIQITDSDGCAAAVATWNYTPLKMQHALTDLNNALIKHCGSAPQIVKIERLQVNITHLHDQATSFNVQQFMAEAENISPELRNNLLSAYEAHRKKKG